ncbi:MAG: EamA family transporter [archaeon]
MEWYLFAFGSAIFTALAVIIEKKSLIKQHSIEFSCVLSIFMFILSLIFIRLVDFNLDLRIWILIALESLFFGLSTFFTAKAIRHMEVSSASSLMVFLPVFILFFAVIILGETISYLQLLGIFLLIVGIYILEIRKGGFLKPFANIFKRQYINYVFLSLALMALSLILARYLLSTKLVDVYTLTFISYTFFMVYMIILIFLLHDGINGIMRGFKTSGVLIFFAATFILVAKLLQNQAILIQNVTLVETIRRTYVIIVILLGGELFHEKNLTKKIIATLVMLFGAYLIIL